MKFGHSFLQTLETEGFPPEWRNAAMPYRELKKCIKRVHAELAALGLDAAALKCLIADSQDGTSGGPTLTYLFDGTIHSFEPKLALTVGKEGLPLNIGLSEDTRRNLENLVKQRARVQDVDEESAEGVSNTNRPGVITQTVSSSPSNCEYSAEEEVPTVSMVEPTSSLLDPANMAGTNEPSTVYITLSADSEFFHILASELNSLSTVQSRAVESIESSIISMGDTITTLTQPTTMVRHSDLYPWREILQIYVESNIFISNLEAERSSEQSVERAADRLAKFRQRLEASGAKQRFKSKRSLVLLGEFQRMNEEVLRVMRFQAINQEAMRKILKKFDKQTSLSAGTTFPSLVATHPLVSTSLAKAIYFTMTSRLLNILPQLDDYLCPICASIAVKPVRLECLHLFCVRCLVKLQRENSRLCPLCRKDVVMQADASNLDPALLNFLKGYFPREAREKQKENDIEVGKELWGNVHAEAKDPRECVIM